MQSQCRLEPPAAWSTFFSRPKISRDIFGFGVRNTGFEGNFCGKHKGGAQILQKVALFHQNNVDLLPQPYNPRDMMREMVTSRRGAASEPQATGGAEWDNDAWR